LRHRKKRIKDAASQQNTNGGGRGLTAQRIGGSAWSWEGVEGEKRGTIRRPRRPGNALNILCEPELISQNQRGLENHLTPEGRNPQSWTRFIEIFSVFRVGEKDRDLFDPFRPREGQSVHTKNGTITDFERGRGRAKQTCPLARGKSPAVFTSVRQKRRPKINRENSSKTIRKVGKFFCSVLRQTRLKKNQALARQVYQT